MNEIRTPERAVQLLDALGEQLDHAGAAYELVVVGGSALLALAPTRDELLAAARWTLTHDPSPAYRGVLEQGLAVLGVEDAALGA